jgi:hypothetical protein
MHDVLTVPVSISLLVAMVLILRYSFRHILPLQGAGGPWDGRGAECLARAATALGAFGGGDLTKDGVFVLPLDGRSLRVFGAQPGKGRNVVVGLGLEAVASNVAGAAGSPFRGASGRQALEQLPRIVLRRETDFERFGKRLGLNVELHTGDDRFDAHVYVDSEAPRGDVAAVLADERVRRGALGLLDAGCLYVTFAGAPHSLTALWPSFGRAKISPEVLQACGRHLLDIADGLPPFRQVAAGGAPDRVRWLEIAYFVLGIAAMALGAISNELWPLINRNLIALAVGLALLNISALLALGIVVLRNRSDSLPRLCVAAVGATMLGPGLAVAGLNFANGWHDLTTIEHSVKIVGSESGMTKSRTSYALLVEPWAPETQPYRFDVSREQFELSLVRRSTHLIVHTGAGRLGYEWLRSVEVR